MKETNILLSPEELHKLLKGSLQWADVASRTTSSRTGFRKLGANISEKQSTSQQFTSQQATAQQTTEQQFASQQTTSVEQRGNYYLPQEEKQSLKRLEGLPVVWLLGSVGLLTLSSWFYFVLFSK